MHNSFTYLAVASFALIGSSCHINSSVPESPNDAGVMSATSSLSAEEMLLNSALVIDLSPELYSRRVERIASEALALPATEKSAAGSEQAPMSPQLPNGACGIRLHDKGTMQTMTIDDQLAMPLPDGRVVYCNKGVPSWAMVDTETPTLLLKIGMTANELSAVRFYRVPTSTVNAFATVTDSNIPVVVVYDGLAANARMQGIDAPSLLSGVLAHEFGHIVDMQKAGFGNLKASRQRVVAECLNRTQSLQPESVEYQVRLESCQRALGANSRTYEYSADNYAIQLFGRKRYPADINPFEIAKFFKAIGNGRYDPFDSHPDGFERALQFERSLQRLGIKEANAATPLMK
ncbi:hypothetical protein EBU99_13010 [bacterium]|nr:hypothetical protein [bacterium]